MDGLNLSIFPDLIGHTNNVNCCAYSPDGKNIVTASRDKTVKLWEFKTGNCYQTLKGH